MPLYENVGNKFLEPVSGHSVQRKLCRFRIVVAGG